MHTSAYFIFHKINKIKPNTFVRGRRGFGDQNFSPDVNNECGNVEYSENKLR